MNISVHIQLVTLIDAVIDLSLHQSIKVMVADHWANQIDTIIRDENSLWFSGQIDTTFIKNFLGGMPPDPLAYARYDRLIVLVIVIPLLFSICCFHLCIITLGLVLMICLRSQLVRMRIGCSSPCGRRDDRGLCEKKTRENSLVCV